MKEIKIGQTVYYARRNDTEEYYVGDGYFSDKEDQTPKLYADKGSLKKSMRQPRWQGKIDPTTVTICEGTISLFETKSERWEKTKEEQYYDSVGDQS